LKTNIAEIVGMFGGSPAAESSEQGGNLQCVKIVCAVVCQRVLKIHEVYDNGRMNVEICRY